MQPPLYTASVPALLRYLETLERVLRAVERDCAGREAEVLDCRLAPGMMPLRAQIDTAAHLALRTALPLAGRQVPAFTASAAGLAGLELTLARTAEQLRLLNAEDFAAAEQRIIPEVAGEASLQLPAWTFLTEFALPNFLFHVTMAYAIARSQGCALGKAQFDAYHVYPGP